MKFASDNTSGVAPEIMAALQAANEGYATGYGDDEITARVEQKLAEVFEKDVAVFLVATGSAANALALSVLSPPYGAIYCHETAHIQVDEAGAPEFYTHGAKLMSIAGAQGKITPDGLKKAIGFFVRGDVHQPQGAALSLTQLTEWGTAYTLDEIRTLARISHEADLKVHMDGARFTNALVALGCTPAEMTWKAGIDVLSFGATKNGAMGVEAIVFFDKALAGDFANRRKRGAHLMSKHRFLAVQMETYLKDGLWLRMAKHSNAMAARLATGLTTAGFEVASEGDANQLFPLMSDNEAEALRAAGAYFYDWPYGIPNARRLVTSFSTTEADVDAFIEVAGRVKD